MGKSETKETTALKAAPNGGPGRTLVHRFDNGLKLLIHEKHDVPVATADIWVGTGSADETPEIGGISHFLEHMLFKGTEKFALGQIEREIENVGGQSNAGTSYDFTHYYLTLPAGSIGRGIEMLAEMVKHSTLDAAELEKERLVILEEYRRKQDNPGAMLFENLFEQLYEAGPYHRSVIGTEQSIKSITREQMFDYYGRHYAPENMTFLVVGDVDPQAAIEAVGRQFDGFERPLRPLLTEGPEATRVARAKRFHQDKTTGGEAYAAWAVSAPGAEHTQTIVPLDVAQYILGQGRASVLFQELREKRRLCSTVSVDYYTQRHAASFILEATCDPEKLDQLRAALMEEIEKFKNEPIDRRQFERARRLLKSGHLFSFETTGAMSSQIGYYHRLTGGTEFLERYLEELAAVTPQQVQRTFAEITEGNEWVEVTVGPEVANGASGNGRGVTANPETPNGGQS